MTSFRFRFESLLALRRRQRDEIGLELGNAHQAIGRVDEQIAALQQRRDQIRADAAVRFRGSASEVRKLSIDRLQHEARYDGQLADDQTAFRSSRDQLAVELEQRRGRLVEAEAEVKRLERLRANQAAEHEHLQLQREQAAADELTSARIILSRRGVY